MAEKRKKENEKEQIKAQEQTQPQEKPEETPVSNEEQMLKRQSAPKPTAEDEMMRIREAQQAQMMSNQGIGANGAIDGLKALKQPVGKEQVQKAMLTLNRYREGKINLENKIKSNEQWYKMRHWEQMRDQKNEVEPTSGWLFNCIANKHADAMDNFPSPNVLPREEGDKAEAKMLTSIIPVILDQNDFEQTYSEVQMYKLKTGTGVYGVFWDGSKLNGLGDISIRKVDILNLFWESGITDIQKSRNVFHVELCDNNLLLDAYPQLQGKLGGSSVSITEYMYDDKVDTTNKSLVVDWYYKKSVNGKTLLHFCKFVNDEVLFCTENDERFADTGFYDHAMYPFVFDTLYPVEGTPTGFGYIDVGKDSQAYIDRGNQAIMRNMLANAKPRFFVREDGAVNENEFADTNKDIVHVNGNLGTDSIIPIKGNVLNNIYLSVLQGKIEELKETTGNRDVSTGGTTSGATAASAIAAMQEAGSKLSRDNNKASYRAFRKIVVMVIELIRQFYDLPRCFRIMGDNGAAEYVQYSNAGIQPQMQGGIEMGIDMGYRIPLFDVEITAQKQSPYSKMAQNELALSFYSAGFFNPQIADQALACLDMMDFDRKQFVMQKIAENGGMYQQMMAMQQQMIMLAQMVDQMRGSNIADQLTAQFMGGAPVVPNDGVNPAKNVEKTEALGGEEGGTESHVTKKARQRVAESTSPT